MIFFSCVDCKVSVLCATQRNEEVMWRFQGGHVWMPSDDRRMNSGGYFFAPLYMYVVTHPQLLAHDFDAAPQIWTYLCAVWRGRLRGQFHTAAVTALIEQPLLHLRTHFVSRTSMMVDFFFSFFPPWDWIVVYRFRNATSACSIRLWHIKQQSLYYKEHAVNVSGV